MGTERRTVDRTARPGAWRRPRPDTYRARVLVVEDDVPTCEMLVEFLRLEGFAVDRAPNGRIALDRVQAHRLDVVLLDLLMPVMDGQREHGR
jgi:CheY-like chemotaxis protein